MTTEERVMTLFDRANPVPDVESQHAANIDAAGYLTVLSQRSTEMAELDTRESAPTKRGRRDRQRTPGSQRRRVALLAAGAAFLVAVVVAGVVAIMATDEPEVADTTTTIETPPTTTVAPTPEEAEARAAIDAAYALFNSGDAVGWAQLEHRSELEPPTLSQLENDLSTSWEMAAGARIEVEECTSLGFGEREGNIERSPVSGLFFACVTSMTDDFREPAGIVLEERTQWIVSEGEIVAKDGDPIGQSHLWDRFMRDYRTWFVTTYPDIAATIPWSEEDHAEVPDPESTAILLQYVDEYIATRE